jgi:4-amino-4-deoxy-L-arabinose transferase-like glycosyltransferase
MVRNHSGAQASDYRWMLLVLLVCIEAFVVLRWSHLSEIALANGDDIEYHNLAVNLIQSHRFSAAAGPPFELTASKPPGYPLFLAFAYSISGYSFAFLRVCQFTLLAAASVLLYATAKEVVDKQSALITGLWCATYPAFWGMALRHMTEILSVFLMTAFVWLLTRAMRQSSLPSLDYSSVGIALAASVLVRASFALLLLPTAALLVRNDERGFRGRRRPLLFLVLSFCLAVAPWIARNTIQTHAFIPLGTSSGMSLYTSVMQYKGVLSGKMDFHDWQHWLPQASMILSRASVAVKPGNYDQHLMAEVQEDKEFKLEAIHQLRSLTLLQLLRSVPTRLAGFWGVADFSPLAMTRFHRVVQFHYAFTVILILTGIYLSRSNLRQHLCFWLVPVYLMALHSIFHSETRYSLPARQFLFLYVGVALSTAISWIGSLSVRRRSATQCSARYPGVNDGHVRETSVISEGRLQRAADSTTGTEKT